MSFLVLCLFDKWPTICRITSHALQSIYSGWGPITTVEKNYSLSGKKCSHDPYAIHPAGGLTSNAVRRHLKAKIAGDSSGLQRRERKSWTWTKKCSLTWKNRPLHLYTFPVSVHSYPGYYKCCNQRILHKPWIYLASAWWIHVPL